ncbi:MAG: glycosyltransferase family 39 protein [Chloroflexia bacterium]
MQRGDLMAVAAILAGYALALALMPIQHNFSYVDDWVFFRAAERIVDGQGFVPPDFGQMSLVSHAYWGALFGSLLGMNLTVATAATMVMGLVACLSFYAILRLLGFTPGLSGLGVALMAFNPFFVTLSYSFMTEVTFVAFMLLSCLCYLLGIRERTTVDGGRWTVDGENTKRETRNASMGIHRLSSTVYRLSSIAWLAAGGLFAALAFLTRQFGLALPVAVLVWLVVARKASWGRAAAVMGLPVAAVVGYYALVGGGGSTFSDSQSRNEIMGLFTSLDAWTHRLKSLSFALPMIGLAVPLFLKVRWWVPAGLLAVVAGAVVAIQGNRRDESVALSAHVAEPFDIGQPFRLEFTPFWWVAAAITVWAVFRLAEQAWPGLRALIGGRRRIEPVEFFYLAGIFLLAGTFLARMEIYVRYLLPVIPFVIIAGLKQLEGRSVRQLAPTLAVLVITGAVAIALHLDDYSFLKTRWQAGHDLVAQGVPYTQINNGFTWDSYYLYDQALREVGSRDLETLGAETLPEKIIDPVYVIGVNQPEGYTTVRTYNYFSLLDGMTNREIYVMRRN